MTENAQKTEKIEKSDAEWRQQLTPEQYYVTHLMPNKLRSDLEYLATRSPWSDVRIVFDTVGFVFRALVHR